MGIMISFVISKYIKLIVNFSFPSVRPQFLLEDNLLIEKDCKLKYGLPSNHSVYFTNFYTYLLLIIFDSKMEFLKT